MVSFILFKRSARTHRSIPNFLHYHAQSLNYDHIRLSQGRRVYLKLGVNYKKKNDKSVVIAERAVHTTNRTIVKKHFDWHSTMPRIVKSEFGDRKFENN